MKRFQGYAIVGFFVTCFIVIVYFFIYPVVNKPSGEIYYLKPGTSKKAFIADLNALGITNYPTVVSLLLYPHSSSKLKAGEYLFPQDSTLSSIWYQVTHGKGLVSRTFTIVPGWTFKQLRTALAETIYLRHTLNETTNNVDVMRQLSGSDTQPEGQFFPESYQYTRGIADIVILKRAHALMQKKLAEAWNDRANDLPYKNDYEALIAASLIEKEAFLDNERPVIAGVLINRLEHDMLLQFDPTVIYGLGERYTGKLHHENLTEDTPYNTYVHKGLPPTPIAMPSLASLAAALHPDHNDFYYFVARGDGTHQFSKTLIEHNKAVQDEGNKPDHAYFNESRVLQYLTLQKAKCEVCPYFIAA